MLGPIRFVFVIIWFAIGLGMVGTLKDCTLQMGKEAVIAHKRGGISYGWWNRKLMDDGRGKNEKEMHRRGVLLPRPK